jgi:hypothetical protein
MYDVAIYHNTSTLGRVPLHRTTRYLTLHCLSALAKAKKLFKTATTADRAVVRVSQHDSLWNLGSLHYV